MKSTTKKPLRTSLPKVVAVVGPTASGKSALAVEIARNIGGEIISADSRQVYKGLDIGTGKITIKEMKGVPHHLLDVASPKNSFSVSEWAAQASQAITDITSRGNVPIVCGGTGFYTDTLLRGLVLPDVRPNLQLRKKLATKPLNELNRILKKLDPRRAKTIDQKNPHRLIRAIEIATALGNVPKIKTHMLYDTLWIGIDPENDTLKKRIHDRLLLRMKNGMITEAKRLKKEGVSYKRMRELGLEYRFLADHLDGRLTKDEMLSGLESAIGQYAKRQRTWFKRFKDIEWLSIPDSKKAISLAQKFLKKKAPQKRG